MSEVNKGYELKLLKMVVNKYLDETLSVTEENLKALEINLDQVVWELATKIYSQSGHKVELCTVRDIVNSRIEAMKYQLAVEKERIAEQARRIAEEKVRKAAIEEARLRDEIASVLGEFGGDESKAKIFVKVRKIIIEQLEVWPNRVTLDSHIYGDFATDDIDFVEILMSLEEEFGIEIQDYDHEDLYTLRGITDYVVQKIEMGEDYGRDGIYILKISHQSGKISEERYENLKAAWHGYQMQYQYYGKRKLKLYVEDSQLYKSGTLLAAHNFPELIGELQKY